MSRGQFLCAALALGLGLLVPLESSAQQRVGEVEFSVIPMPSLDAQSDGGVTHGYVEYRVRLHNRGPSERIVHLAHPPARARRIDDGVVATRTVRLAGGQQAVVSLFQPPTSVSDERLEVRVEGVARRGEIHLASMRTYTRGYRHHYREPPRAAVLLSRSVPRDFPSDGYSARQPGAQAPGLSDPDPEPDPEPQWHMAMGGLPPSGPAHLQNFVLFRSEIPVDQWSPNWLGYSCFDTVVCSQREVEDMPAAVRLALRRFVECGGTLVVHGHDLPAALSEHAFDDGHGGRYAGMGRVVLSGADDWDAAFAKLVESRHVHQAEERPRNLLGLLMAEATVPVRGLFLLVLLFGVAIGPVNLWLLSRYRRRIWLWWNVPAISLLTCLTVFGYSVASEGWTGRGRTASFTLLDERARRATTIGYVSHYSPLAPGGLRFGAETDVALLDTHAGYRYRRYGYDEPSADLRFVDWTHEQHLASGWMKARVPAYFQIRKNEDRRERLAVEPQPDGSVKVVNALGAGIERLYVADASGRVLEGRNIPAGAERTLSVMAGGVAGEENPDRMRSIFTQSDWLRRFHGIQHAADPAALLAPGCYIAYLERSPFVESPMAGVEPEHTVAIVYGVFR